MKYIIHILIFILLFACQQKSIDLDLAIKKDSCRRSISYNEQIVASVKEQVAKNGRPASDLALVDNCDKIINLRKRFMKNPTSENLLMYSDSVKVRYLKLVKENVEPISTINQLKNQLSKDKDSTCYYNLLYLTTIAEYDLLKDNALRIGVAGVSCSFSYYIPSFLDKKEYLIHDQIFLTINTENALFLNTILDFSKVTCIPVNGGPSLKPMVIKSGPNYILIYNPLNGGKYQIGGGVIVKQEGNFKYSVNIKNEFKIKSPAPDNG